MGHDAVHVSDLNLLGALHSDVMAAARRDERVLISADTDFGELLALSGDHRPSVILLRQSTRAGDASLRALTDNLDAVAADLADGAIVVITNNRIRIRSLPIESPDN
jgi:predicted nuclease of predicted toxin-antitoxin system